MAIDATADGSADAGERLNGEDVTGDGRSARASEAEAANASTERSADAITRRSAAGGAGLPMRRCPRRRTGW